MKKQEGLVLRFLYNTVIGRGVLKIFVSPFVSKMGGFVLSTRFSKIFVDRFARKNNIDVSDYYVDDIKSFNDFFARKVKEDKRPIDMVKKDFISPADGHLSFYRIDDDLVIPVKQSMFRISTLLESEELAKKYEDGICIVIRLCVDNYHRYCYLDDGSKTNNVYIPGKLHTVRPIALANIPVFTENAREYTILSTDNFGDVAQIEVGALMVGKIKNNHQEHDFKRGEEKGMFLFGGSTIILLVEKNKIKIPDEYFEMTKNEQELDIKMGEKIALKYTKKN
ncbi:MAG: phosphatidylserine decarboxylase [Bacilli bacterium]|nr:phosphatidylserine decarboxylase [Bacilli bacterium]